MRYSKWSAEVVGTLQAQRTRQQPPHCPSIQAHQREQRESANRIERLLFQSQKEYRRADITVFSDIHWANITPGVLIIIIFIPRAGAMSSYVSVLGTPTGETTCVFGLTPQEVRYLQVSQRQTILR